MMAMQVTASALRPSWGGGASDKDEEAEDGEGLLSNWQVGGGGDLSGLSMLPPSEGAVEGQQWKGC